MARLRTHIGSRRRNRLSTDVVPPLYRGSVAEHEGRVPQPGVPAGPRNGGTKRAPGSQSAGYHEDLSIPGYQPQTPTTAPPTGEAPTGPAGLYPGAHRAYTRAVATLPSPLPPAPSAPNPTLALLSPLGQALGLSSGATGELSATLAALLEPQHDRKQGDGEAHQGPAIAEIAAAKKPPQTPGSDPATAIFSTSGPAHAPLDPHDPLGAKTPGDASLAEIAAAGRAGRLQIGPGGRLTTPVERKAIHDLRTAQRRVGASGASLQALQREYPELSPSTLQAYRAAHRVTGVPPQLLAGIEGQESDYGRSTATGVRSGQNFAGAAGPFQIGNGTGAAGDWWHEHMPPAASPYNDRTAAIGAGKYLTEAGATKDPSTWYDAALSYNHADWYAQKAVELAQAHSDLGKLAKPPDPQARAALAAAKQRARRVGINPTPFNGDVAGGGAGYTVVRADAKGMVDWVESALGTQEGSPKAERWSSRFGLGGTTSQPWCANFVSNGLIRRGITDLPSNPNYVPTYEAEWGKYAVQGGLAKAKPGDLATFNGEHIGVYVGSGEMISGNSSDEVARGPVGQPSMVIRPPYKGGKVRVADSQLTGSTMSGALGSGGEVGVGGAAPASGEFGGAPAAPATAPLTAISSPLSAGPVMPSDLMTSSDPHVSGALETLEALLGEGAMSPTGRPRLG